MISLKIPNYIRGFTLLEIVIALVIIVVGIIPIYQHFSKESGQNLNTEKIQMAEKILNSIKEEVMADDYKKLSTEAKKKLREWLSA